MAIVMIQGPDNTEGRKPDLNLQADLSERAQAAGHALLHYRCATEEQLAERLARIDHRHADIILLEPGRCAGDGPLRRSLRHLRVPYIEVHEDSVDRSETRLPDGAGPRVAVVGGYEAQSYTLAMSMALERIGCAECENDFNVGT